ncbi:MAG: hypothetical protein HYT73_02580 [Candidatus Aenigmarchaeota archaeon]|nr:hypothetical protein [Candidatus Aenigmarchaeota archaeon]
MALAKAGAAGSPRFVMMYRGVCQRVESLERLGFGDDNVVEYKKLLNRVYDRFPDRLKGEGIGKYKLDP